MKRITIILLAVIVSTTLGSCFKQNAGFRYVKSKSYITNYLMFREDFSIISCSCDVDGNISIGCQLCDEVGRYSGYSYDDDPGSIFWKTAEKYGDTGYERFGWKVYIFNSSHLSDPYIRAATANTINRIDITSDMEWDTAHKAGDILNDCFTISYRSYADFIESGYAEAEKASVDRVRTVPIDELKENDLRLLRNWPDSKTPIFAFKSTTPPTVAGTHNLSITLYLDDGTTRTGSVETVIQ